MSWLNPLDVALYLAAGAVVGTIYFALLFRTVRLHAFHTAAVGIVPLYIVRFAVAASAFWAIAQRGALPLMLALLGFLMARIAIQRWMGSE